MKNTFTIFALSDATGDLAHRLAVAASRQFKEVKAEIVQKGRVKSAKRITDIITEARQANAVILFTMVSTPLRLFVLEESKRQNVAAMDIMGPVLDMLSHYFHTLPSDEPGLQYKLTQEYFKRTEAIEYTVRHDDGMGMDTLDKADIILLGVSRSSKTPLCIYLAYQGYRCANIPIVPGGELPEAVTRANPAKLVGLKIAAESLVAIRSSRLEKMGRPITEDYAQMNYVVREIEHAQRVFDRLPALPIVDMTGKAIEEIAIEIIHQIELNKEKY